MPVEDGEIVVSGAGDVTQAWLDVSVAGIATGNARRDRDLLAARFLDAARCPAIRVSVDAATPTSDGWTATGTLRARGISAPVDLTAAVVGRAGSEVRIRVTARLDRRPLAIKVPSFVIGRFVDLEADLTFRPVHDVETSPGTGAPR
jgi:polyisoprenoid-binding protein YceI